MGVDPHRDGPEKAVPPLPVTLWPVESHSPAQGLTSAVVSHRHPVDALEDALKLILRDISKSEFVKG